LVDFSFDLLNFFQRKRMFM